MSEPKDDFDKAVVQKRIEGLEVELQAMRARLHDAAMENDKLGYEVRAMKDRLRNARIGYSVAVQAITEAYVRAMIEMEESG